MRSLRNMTLAGFVVYARAKNAGVYMGALYCIEGFDAPSGVLFCLN